MKLIQFQSSYFNPTYVAQVITDGRTVTVYTRSYPEQSTFKFPTPLEARAAAEAFVLDFDFGQSDNNQILQRMEALEVANAERHTAVMSKLSTLEEQLTEIKKNQDEARAEIRAKLDDQAKRITDLEASLSDVEIPEASQNLINDLKAGSKELAYLVPNPA